LNYSFSLSPLGFQLLCVVIRIDFHVVGAQIAAVAEITEPAGPKLNGNSVLGAGRFGDFCYGCDLSADYVKINADYHT